MSSSSSHPGQAPQTSQAADASSSNTTREGYPKDPTPRPVSKGADSAHGCIDYDSGWEVIMRLVRVTIDGSKAKHPFVELCAWDENGNLPGRGSACMNYSIPQRDNEELKPWIDPDTGLGDTVYVNFSRLRGSDKYTVAIYDREKTKKEPGTS